MYRNVFEPDRYQPDGIDLVLAYYGTFIGLLQAWNVHVIFKIKTDIGDDKLDCCELLSMVGNIW